MSPPPIGAWALTLLILSLAISGFAQVSSLCPPGSGLQAASENLWLEKVLASPILTSPSPTLHGLSRYVAPPTLLLLQAPSPSPLSLVIVIPHSPAPFSLLTLPTTQHNLKLQITFLLFSSPSPGHGGRGRSAHGRRTCLCVRGMRGWPLGVQSCGLVGRGASHIDGGCTFSC